MEIEIVIPARKGAEDFLLSRFPDASCDEEWGGWAHWYEGQCGEHYYHEKQAGRVVPEEEQYRFRKQLLRKESRFGEEGP